MSRGTHEFDDEARLIDDEMLISILPSAFSVDPAVEWETFYHLCTLFDHDPTHLLTILSFSFYADNIPLSLKSNT